MKEDYEWYLENYKQLFEEYGDSYVAIKNKKVIGVYNTYAEGVKNTEKTESIGSFIIQKCGQDETAFTNYISSMNFEIKRE